MNAPLAMIGWREWVILPELGIPRIKAKVDTGARTSVLHAFAVESYQEQGKNKVRFSIHPRQHSKNKVIVCIADLIDTRWVTDSGGHRERRHVIQTDLVMANKRWPIEITLTSREDMRFRMLLGRTALKDYFLVNAAASYLLGKKPHVLGILK